MKSNKFNTSKYRIRELIYQDGELIIEHLYTETFETPEFAEECITELKKYDKTHNFFKLKHIYIIEVSYD